MSATDIRNFAEARTMRITTGAAGAVLLGLVLTCIQPALAEIPEPPFTLFGAVTVDGQPAEAGWVRCVTVVSGETLDVSPLGSDYGMGSKYVLRLPMDSLFPQTPGTVRTGQEVDLYVDDLWAGRAVVGARGDISLLNLEASSLHEIEFTGLPTGNPNPATSQALVQVSADASDSQGHALSWHWQASCPGLASSGVFANAAGRTTSWEAPRNTSGSRVPCTITVTASDGLGLTGARSYAQAVDSIADTVAFTQPPAGTPNPVPSGGPVALGAAAADSLGHALAYDWSAACPGFSSNGSFVNNGSATPTWMAPANRADGNRDCTILVEAGHAGAPRARSFYTHTVEPVPHGLAISSVGGTPNPVKSGTPVSLAVAATDSRDHHLAYSWMASCPGAPSNGTFSDSTSRTPAWTPPPIPVTGTAACTVGVTVDDGHGTSRIATYQQTVYGGAPVAVIEATPDPVTCPGEVALDGSASYHENPSAAIVSWEWDFHYDGIDFGPEASGPEASVAWGEVGAHTVALRVTDGGSPPVSVIATAEVAVDGIPPEADAGGPYLLDRGDPLPLDASRSSDPDAPCGDRLTGFAWDLNGDGIFGDVEGAKVGLSWPELETKVCEGDCREAQAYPLAVRVTDTLGYQAEAASILWIGPLDKEVKLVAPNGGEMLGNGETRTIRWLSGGDLDEVRLLLSLDGRATWREILPPAGPSEGQADWTVPVSVIRTQRDCRLKIVGISAETPAAEDLTDGPFAIGPIDVTFPERGAILAGGAPVTVAWDRYLAVREPKSARLRYTLNGGLTWREIRRTRASGTGTFTWNVPAARTRKDRCRVEVTLLDETGIPVAQDAGEGTFTVLGPVDLTGPEKGAKVYGGTSRSVTWETRPGVEVASTRIQFTSADSPGWKTIAVLDGNPGVFHWSIPGTASDIGGCRLRLQLLGPRGEVLGRDLGEGSFTIVPWP